jgi:hypothetical protein
MQDEISERLKPYEANTKCERCKKMFYTDLDHQRGSKRRYCSLRCRNAAYVERRTIENKTMEATIAELERKNARLSATITKLEEENKQLREGKFVEYKPRY